MGFEPMRPLTDLITFQAILLSHLSNPPYFEEDREHDSHTFYRTNCLANSVVDLHNLPSKGDDSEPKSLVTICTTRRIRTHNY